MQVALNKKSTKEITLYSVGLYLNVWFLFSVSKKKNALIIIATHLTCIFTKNITTYTVPNFCPGIFIKAQW